MGKPDAGRTSRLAGAGGTLGKAWGGQALVTIAAQLCPDHGSCLFLHQLRPLTLVRRQGKGKGSFPSTTEEWQPWFGRGWVQDACESGVVSVRLLELMAFSLESRKY